MVLAQPSSLFFWDITYELCDTNHHAASENEKINSMNKTIRWSKDKKYEIRWLLRQHVKVDCFSLVCRTDKRLSILFYYLFVIDTCLNLKTQLILVCKYD